MKAKGVIRALLCVGFAVFSVQCGGGGTSVSNGGRGTGSGGGNTITLSSLSPVVAMQNGAAFALTLNGTGFVSGNQIVLNGIAEPTTLVGGQQLTAQIPSSALTPSPLNGFDVTVQGAANSPTALKFYVVPEINPSSVTVAAGTVNSGIDIQVGILNPVLQLQSIGGCVCVTATSAGVSEVTVHPGQKVNLFVVGNGIVIGTFYIITGDGITVTQPLAADFTHTTAPVTPAVNFNITVASSATAGPRNLIVTDPSGDISIYPGAIVVSSGS